VPITPVSSFSQDGAINPFLTGNRVVVVVGNLVVVVGDCNLRAAVVGVAIVVLS